MCPFDKAQRVRRSAPQIEQSWRHRIPPDARFGVGCPVLGGESPPTPATHHAPANAILGSPRLRVVRLTAGVAFLVLADFPGTAVSGAAPVAPATRIAVGERPLIDGRIREACWDKASWQGEFKVLGTEAPAINQTRFRVLYDEDNLYLAADCLEPAMDQLKVLKGGGIFRGDSVELFFDLDCDQQTDVHLTVNVLGVCEGRNFVWRAAGNRAQDRWTVEAVIPFSSFVIGPHVGSAWGFNVCRTRYPVQREYTTWSVLSPMGGYHQPVCFGRLEGLDADFSMLRYVVGAPEIYTQIKGRGLDVRFGIAVANETGKTAELRLEGSLIPPVGKPQLNDVRLSLEPGAKLTPELAGYTVTQSGDYELLLALTDNVAGEVYYRTRIPVRLHHTPLAIRMVQPCYRDTVFSTQKLTEVKLLIDVGLDEADLKTSSLTVELSAAGAGQPLQTRNVAAVRASPVEVTFGATALTVGDYLIRVTLADAKGREVAVAERPLHKLPPAPGSEVRLDENNNTVINGVPTLIYGYFSAGSGTYPGRDCEGMAQLAADGCTAILEYNEPYWSRESGNLFLDTAHRNGLKVTVYPYYRTFHRQGGLPKVGAPDPSLPEKMRQQIAERVGMWKDHPAFLAWYLADEPDCSNSSPAALQEVYELVRDLDPYHPCIVLCKSASTHHAVRNCADIFMPDPYIHPRIDGKFDTPLTAFRAYFETIKQEGKAAWVTPQAFASGFRNGSLMCEPSLDHLRAMAYMSFAHHAKGILYYAWNYLSGFPASHHGARYLCREVAALAPLLLAPDTHLKAEVKPDDGGIDVLVKEYGGQIYVIAVNTQFAEVDAVFSLPGLGNREVSVIFEDRAVRAQGDGFSDHFGEYDVHLYTTAASPPRVGKTLAQVRIEVAAMQAARFKPGNLALRMTKAGGLTGVNVEWEQGCQSIDGYTDLFTAYRWNTRPKPPTDLTLTFPRQETVARAVVYTPQIKDCEIQIPDGENWRPIAAVTGNTERIITTRFEPVKTGKLRLHITAIHPPEWEKETYGFAAHGAIVDEIEVYGP